MSSELIKLGPLAGFLLAVGYCVWPHVAPPPHQPAPTAQLPRIDPEQLRPRFDPHPPRDPFLDAAAARLAEAKAEAASGRDAAPAGAAAAATGPAALGPPPAFSLGATLVSGDRRAAIIDGRVYRQGEALEMPPGSPRGTWTVSRIEPGRVLIGREHRRDLVALELPDRLAALAAGGGAGGDPPRPDPTGLGRGLEALAEARAALAAAGVHLPVPDLMEQIAHQSGGSLLEASRSLLRLLASAPQVPGQSPGAGRGTALAASVEGPR